MNKTGEFESQVEKNAVIETIRKQLLGKKLSYSEIYTLMDSIAKQKLGDILTTYFAASSYSRGFSNEELYYFTKAMVETGEKLTFKGIVADKHSIGGLPGTRTTFIVVPIVAAAGFTIPKSSSRAITTPSGTADDMEVLAPVIFTKEQIYKIVKDTNGCIVWGGSFNIAPADDVIIQIEEPLLFESFDKIVISIMAKKVAFGSNHIVIDIPYGESVKVHRIKDAEILKVKFEYLAKRFNMKIKCLISKTDEPIGRGVGPVLETREAIRVLQQKENRPLDLEERSLTLAGNLLDLCLEDSPKEHKNGLEWAKYLLRSNLAFAKIQEIIKAQGGNPNIDSEDLKPGKFSVSVLSHKKGAVKKINSQNATIIAKILGAPGQKRSGIFLNKKIGEPVFEKEILYTLYSENVYNLKEAKSSLRQFPIVLI